MADITTLQPAAGTRRLTAWIERRQQAWSDRIHADSDAVARDAGWTVTRQTGCLGFGGRTYRDPRFDQLHAERTGRGPG